MLNENQLAEWEDDRKALEYERAAHERTFATLLGACIVVTIQTGVIIHMVLT